MLIEGLDPNYDGRRVERGVCRRGVDRVSDIDGWAGFQGAGPASFIAFEWNQSGIPQWASLESS